MKILPNVKTEYLPGQNLIPYMQIYNMDIDQTSQKPSLDITFTVKSGDTIVEEIKGTADKLRAILLWTARGAAGKNPFEKRRPRKILA